MVSGKNMCQGWEGLQEAEEVNVCGSQQGGEKVPVEETGEHAASYSSYTVTTNPKVKNKG